MPDDISTLFHAAVRDIDAPTRRLVTGGIARGRRRRRLVRAGEALSAAVLLGGAAALLVALVPGSGPSSHGGVAAAGSVSARPSVAATQPDRPPAQPVRTTPQALVQTTIDLLPRPGDTSGYDGSTNADAKIVAGQLRYDDGHGTALVDTSIEWDTDAHQLDYECADGTADCSYLPDGSRLALSQGHVRPGDASSGLEWAAAVEHDGILVTVAEFNSTQEKDAATTRPEPPFTIGELRTMAESPRYTLEISPDRADAAAGLFDPDAGSRPSTSATRTG